MMMLKFTEKIKKWEPLDVYNYGNNIRDFTYIDDVIDWILKAINYDTQYDVFNIWSSNPVKHEYVISLLEKCLWKKAIKNYLPPQPGDMLETNADIQHTKNILWWEPKVSIEEWIKSFIERYNSYY